jgi:hypothetical protein
LPHAISRARLHQKRRRLVLMNLPRIG